MPSRSTSTSSTDVAIVTEPGNDLPLVEVGKVGRAHGVHGDVYVSLLTDRTERLAPGARLLVGEEWCSVTRSRPAGQRWLVHFDGVDDRTHAERLAHRVLRAEPLADRGDGWYVDQLIGANVVDSGGTVLGTCVAVVANPAHDLLELADGTLIPVVFVTEIRQGSISVDLPEGLLDL